MLSSRQIAKWLSPNPAWHLQIIKILVGSAMVLLYAWIVRGLISIAVQWRQSWGVSWTEGVEATIVEMVTILAILELIRTLQSYLILGRVKVSFILDAALVVLIGELIGLSFLHYSMQQIFLHLAVIILLGLLRTLTVKTSPRLSLRNTNSTTSKEPNINSIGEAPLVVNDTEQNQ